MRRIRYVVAASLDGYIAGPQGEADWIIMDPDIDFGALFAEFDTILLGRRTFETMAGSAPLALFELGAWLVFTMAVIHRLRTSHDARERWRDLLVWCGVTVPIATTFAFSLWVTPIVLPRSSSSGCPPSF